MAHYFGDALSEIKKIKGKVDGHLDMDTMPAFGKLERRVVEPADKKNGTADKITVYVERDLGAMITMLTVAVQQLIDRIEILEKGAK